jgi:hypothetical protein
MMMMMMGALQCAYPGATCIAAVTQFTEPTRYDPRVAAQGPAHAQHARTITAHTTKQWVGEIEYPQTSPEQLQKATLLPTGIVMNKLQTG